MARRKGRGRLSSIDLLPPEADPIVLWAAKELDARELPQIDLLEEFNKRLANLALEHNLDIQPISKSAFNRHSIRLSTTARRLKEGRDIAGALTERLGPDQSDSLTIMVSEFIKTLVFEMLEGAEAGSINPKGAAELARALKTAVQAQSISTDRRRKVEKEFADKAEKAIDKVADEAGLSAEIVSQLRRDFLGVRE